ncbi:MAG: hypothetical protein AB7K52_07080 [Phycisphaerales bacterium]
MNTVRFFVVWLAALCTSVASLAQPVTGSLDVSGVRVSPSPAMSNQAVVVTFTVTNQGPGLGQLSRYEVIVDGAVQSSTSSLIVFNSPGNSRDFSAPAPMPPVAAGSSRNATVTIRITDVRNISDSASAFVTVTGPPRPDLAPVQPLGWSGPIVVSGVTGTTTTQPLIPFGSPAYVDIGYQNFGGAMQLPLPAARVQVLLDALVVFDFPDSPLGANERRTQLDILIPSASLAPGPHTILLRLDPLNAVAESNEGNNEAQVQFVITDPEPSCPADYNGDGQLDPDDLGDFINDYFAQPPCECADFNDVGLIDPDDLGDFINAYFQGCP